MIKLFIRFYLIMLVVIGGIFIYGDRIFIFNPVMVELVGNNMSAGFTAPMFRYIDHRLQGKPEKTWPLIVAKLTPEAAHYPLTIEPLAAVQLGSRQMKRLKQGEVIGQYYFFEEPLQSHGSAYMTVVYQRIGQSDQVLRYVVQPGQDFSYLTQEQWLIHFIQLDLNAAPKQNEQQILQNFSSQYGVGLKIISFATLTPQKQTYLQQHRYISDNLNIGAPLYFYYLMDDGRVLVIEHFYSTYLKFTVDVAIGLMTLLVAVLMMLLSLYPLSRDLKKLDRLAEAYGEGRFSDDVKINRFSALSRLYQNLKKMGVRIQTLLSSHKELTQAVSHELKTPLSRLRFALTMAQEAKIKKEIQANLQHAEDAAADLEQLVGELLIYTRFDRQLFNMGKEHFLLAELLPLLQEQQTKYPNKRLTWDVPVALQTIKINIAPQYFKKIMENLLSNAFRYAQTHIHLSVSIVKQQLWLEVVDDGPGIALADRKRVFEPFVSLDESRNKELSGHGLGLAIVERIVTTYQGEIFVTESETLKGAAFVLTFPVLMI